MKVREIDISRNWKIFTFVMYLVNKIKVLTKGIDLLTDLLKELNELMNYRDD